MTKTAVKLFAGRVIMKFTVRNPRRPLLTLLVDQVSKCNRHRDSVMRLCSLCNETARPQSAREAVLLIKSNEKVPGGRLFALEINKQNKNERGQNVVIDTRGNIMRRAAGTD